MSLWDYDGVCVSEHIEVPPWIEQDITLYDIAAIVQGGCASGAYMPAVTYYDAAKTMYDYGDTVLEFIEDALGEIPQIGQNSWDGYACTLLSYAVELFAHGIEDELLELIEDDED